MIKIGDSYVILEDDAEGGGIHLRKWIARYIRLDDIRDFVEPVAAKSLRRQSRAPHKSGVGIQAANWPPLPEPRINTLTWPTGASRWARAYFITNGPYAAQIFEKANEGGKSNPLTLKMGGDGTEIIETSMYLLPPRRIGGTDSGELTSGEKLDNSYWLLHLVDERYWWQFKSAGLLKTLHNHTWSTVFTNLTSALGISVQPPEVDSAYGNPDPAELSRMYDNPAVLLDAVAMSVGLRVVRQLDGTVSFESPSPEKLTNNITQDQTWKQIAGRVIGNEPRSSDGNRPAAVRVTFPKYRNGMAFCDGELHSLTKNAEEGVTAEDTEKVVHSSHYADFTDVENPDSGSPENESELQALTDKIAADYYEWLKYDYDSTFQGMKPWTFCGWDNYVEWTHGRQLPDDPGGEPYNQNRITQTRIQSLPFNFGVEGQLSQSSDLRPFGPMQIGVAAEDSHQGDPPEVPEGGFEVDIYEGQPGAEASSGRTVKAYPWPEDTRIKEGQKIAVVQNCEARAWYAVTLPEAYDRCKATVKGAFMAEDETFTVDNVIATRGVSPLDDPEDAEEELTVQNDFGWSGADDSEVWIEHHKDDSEWHIYAPEMGQAQFIEGYVDADFDFSDSSADMNVDTVDTGEDPSGGNVFTVTNPPSGFSGLGYMFRGIAGLRIRAQRWGSEYRILWVECEE